MVTVLLGRPISVKRTETGASGLPGHLECLTCSYYDQKKSKLGLHFFAAFLPLPDSYGHARLAGCVSHRYGDGHSASGLGTGGNCCIDLQNT